MNHIWKNLFLYFLLLFVIICEQTLGQRVSKCEKYEWSCNNGECIASDELCDGRADCRDGSDETPESCVHIRCPQFAFRCAYGACVSGDAECNNVTECVDNSDETSISCPGVLQNIKLNGNCSEDEIQCLTGKCIPTEDACDGKADCDDGSDETVRVCAGRYCPSFAFRCGYGACISGDAKCDGVKDCNDGSDETPTLCGSSSPRPGPGPDEQPTKRPTPRPTPRPQVTQSPVSGCRVEDRQNIIFVYESNHNDVIYPGEYVPNYVSIAYKCRPKHLLTGGRTNLCIDGQWANETPTCTKYCSNVPITGVTFSATCELNGVTVSCFRPILPGTTAKISCEFGYRKPDRIVQDILVCQDNGQWDYYPFRCEPICGTEPIHSQAFILDGEKINNTLVPWHTSIYSLKDGRYKQICGGTIISAKVVITAAHCFWDVKNERLYDKSLFAVGAGKYFRDYYADEPVTPQFFNISELHVKPEYRDVELKFQYDIAVLVLDNFIRFKSYIKPICLQWETLGDRTIGSNIVGRVAGWGKYNIFKPSEELRVADLPTISFEECQRRTTEEYRRLITGDKFCVGTHKGQNVCTGDSGGGFAIPKIVGNIKTYFLWGIVSNGLVDELSECQGDYLTAFTNIQFYSTMVIKHETQNRPK